MSDILSDEKKEPEEGGAEALWCAVVRIAVETSLMKIPKATHGNKFQAERQLKIEMDVRRSRKFLTEKGGMLDWICEHVNLNADVIRSEMKRKWRM
jgi:hypothetical protein